MKNLTRLMIVLTWIFGFANGAFAWTTYTTSHTLTYDGAVDGIYTFNDGLIVRNISNPDIPIYLTIEPGVTVRFGSNDQGLVLKGNVVLIAKGLPTSTGYIHFESPQGSDSKKNMINLAMYETTTQSFFPKAVIEYCEFTGPIETGIRSQSADIIIRYNRIHTDCNGIFMADDRYHSTDWVFSNVPQITGNIIEGYGGIYKYPYESSKNGTFSSIEYAGSGIYYHSDCRTAIARNNILIEGKNDKGTACGIFFRHLFSNVDSIVVNNNVIDHILNENEMEEWNCGIYVVADNDMALDTLELYVNNNIFYEASVGIFLHKSNWVYNRPPDLPPYIDFNDYYRINEPMILLGSLSRRNVVDYGRNNTFEDPDFVSIEDVNYRLDENSRLYDRGTDGISAGRVRYLDIHVSSTSDRLDAVDLGAYSGGEECYRIQRHLADNRTQDVTRSWSGSVIKDHNEFIVFHDNMLVKEYADVSDLETSYIVDLPPVSWKFESNTGIVMRSSTSLTVTNLDPSGSGDPCQLYGDNWDGISSQPDVRVYFDNFQMSDCDEIFTGPYRSLMLNDGSISACGSHLISAPMIVDLNLSYITQGATDDRLDNLISIDTVSAGRVELEDCSFYFVEDGIIIGTSNSPITMNDIDLDGSDNQSESIRIDVITSNAPLTINDCDVSIGRFGIRVVQSNGDINVSGNTVNMLGDPLTNPSIFITNMSGQNLLIANNTLPNSRTGIYLSGLESKTSIIDNVISSTTNNLMGISVFYATNSNIQLENNVVEYGTYGLKIGRSNSTFVTIIDDEYTALGANAVAVDIDSHSGGSFTINGLDINDGYKGIDLLNVDADISINDVTIDGIDSEGITITDCDNSSVEITNTNITDADFGVKLSQMEEEISFNGITINNITNNGITITNCINGPLNIIGAGIHYCDYGIKLSHLDGDITINGATLGNIGNDAITVDTCSQGDISIENTIIDFNNNGIYLKTVDDQVDISTIFLQGNTATGSTSGINLQGMTYPVSMDGITCYNEGYSIYSCENSGNISISNSYFYQPTTGSTVNSKGIYSDGDTGSISITNSEFYDYTMGDSYGIRLDRRTGATHIEGNTFSECLEAVKIPATGVALGSITLRDNSYTWSGSTQINSYAIDILSGNPSETALKIIEGETIAGYRVGIRINGLNSNLYITSDCSLQNCAYGIYLSDCQSTTNIISDCTIQNDEMGYYDDGVGLLLVDINQIQLSYADIETMSNCISVNSNTDLTIDHCNLKSTGSSETNDNEGIGIISHAGLEMTNSCIRECAKQAIKIIGDSNMNNAPTLYLGSFDVNNNVVTQGRNLIYNCGQDNGDPAIDLDFDHWMIDLFDTTGTLDKYAKIQAAYNDIVVYQDSQVTSLFYGPCFGLMINHSRDLFDMGSHLDYNYWGRYINDPDHDGTPYQTWFSWMSEDRILNLEEINTISQDRLTTYTIELSDLTQPPSNDAVSLPSGGFSQHSSAKIKDVLANTSYLVINSQDATEIKNALLQINSLDCRGGFTTDQVISQLSKWANPNGSSVLELESHRLKIRKLIKQQKFDEASAALQLWASNPMVMELPKAHEKLYLSYRRKLADLKQNNPFTLNNWYFNELNRINGYASHEIADSKKKVKETSEVENENLPKEFCIHQSYPNPFNPTATLKIDLPETADVKIAIFNVMGQRVYNEVHEQMPAGYKTFNINGQLWSSGTYFVVATAGKMNKVQKIVLIK